MTGSATGNVTANLNEDAAEGVDVMTVGQHPYSKRRQALKWFLVLATVIPMIALIATHVANAQGAPTRITQVDDRVPSPDVAGADLGENGLVVWWRDLANPFPLIDGLGQLTLESFTLERRERTSYGARPWKIMARDLTDTSATVTRPMISGRTYELRVAAFYFKEDGGTTYRY